uniref:NAD-dependent epimerase/dehydratase domain-containing protein n=1 Tax=Helicotheca tamesis TaxID=374047 RepID=A0A7S2DXC6_9STRA|mmetsp:Transcript_10544/g.14791  ORF Transcript_10544/g.14791 Transcript_10544/m.14791 type:complete len:373 (+) Transcript_10544:72-1190(+)|eukprot:CAMPEP_0185726556 /NCGR_PEP_ID=MMETSP1171-20130828/2505_1 /TAXON_ID=374046 /ORGANISM="Helicotheca tamensis, Strain CCMP826" /LENGTH=372 /DNA_ID=CAMNT_0028394939 /DNA_START=139 /DNA_END=1257 /DNA_ORIENTATION=-
MSTASKTAFVTGGTGFLGINLIKLLDEEGWKVTALHRKSSNLTYLKRFPSVSLVVGSIEDKESLKKAIPEGTEVVFHVAGDISMWKKKDAMQSFINIDGTRNLVEAAAEKRVKTFICTSSNSSWGRAKGKITEETPKKGKDSWINYERSKHLGELEAFKGMKLGMKVVSICPADIVGPYDKASYGRCFFLMRDGKLPFSTKGLFSSTHVTELSKAHLAAVTKGKNGECYICAGNDDDVADVLDEIAVMVGHAKPMRLPVWVRYIGAYISDVIAMFTGVEPDDTPEITAITTTSGLSWCSDKAIKELNYKIVPMKTALKDSYDWLVDEGLLEKHDDKGPASSGGNSGFLAIVIVVVLAVLLSQTGIVQNFLSS